MLSFRINEISPVAFRFTLFSFLLQNIQKLIETNKIFSILRQLMYSLRSIILFANIDVSRYILVVDISVLAKSDMGRREYINQVN
jgi:phosphoglycerol transferase MdoB-like AlkP superfamily enzyme